MKTNEWLAQENMMLESYLRRVYPNMDLSAITDRKQGRNKKKTEVAKANFVPLSAEEKANICSHELDAVLQQISEVEKKAQDEISEVRFV
jgi:CRISPR/Cas system-associated protein Csm6